MPLNVATLKLFADFVKKLYHFFGHEQAEGMARRRDGL